MKTNKQTKKKKKQKKPADFGKIDGASQVVLVIKNLASSSGEVKRYGFNPWGGKIPGEWHGNPL